MQDGTAVCRMASSHLSLPWFSRAMPGSRQAARSAAAGSHHDRNQKWRHGTVAVTAPAARRKSSSPSDRPAAHHSRERKHQTPIGPPSQVVFSVRPSISTPPHLPKALRARYARPADGDRAEQPPIRVAACRTWRRLPGNARSAQAAFAAAPSCATPPSWSGGRAPASARPAQAVLASRPLAAPRPFTSGTAVRAGRHMSLRCRHGTVSSLARPP